MKRAWAGVALVVVCVVVFATPAGAFDRTTRRKPGPLRVVLVGDSITVNYEFMAEAELAAKGYQVIPAAIPGSGLLDKPICGAAYARNVVRFADPDVVVAEYNGNYGTLMKQGIGKCLPEKEYGSAPWLRRWKSAATNNQRAYTRRGARFLWIEAPAVNYSPKGDVEPKLNDIYHSLGPTIDAWTAFGGATFDPSMHSDAQHLNPDGAQMMADLVATATETPPETQTGAGTGS